MSMVKKNVVEVVRTPGLGKAGSFERRLDAIVSRFNDKPRSVAPAVPIITKK